MRILLVLFSGLLLLIALAGIGFGFAVMSQATHQGAGGLVAAFTVSVLPFLIGTVALGAVGIIFAVEAAREEHSVLLRAIGRQIVGSPSTDPAVLAKRAREAHAPTK
jgi:hypothetical protein